MAKNQKNDKINIFLSNIALLNIKIHNLHWNVIGPEFITIHKLTETIYKMFQEQFDTVAESLKMQDKMPLVTMADYMENATLEEIEGREYSVSEVLQILDEDCQNITELALDIRNQADKEDNFMIANLFEEYLAVYAKYSWMIRAMLKGDFEIDTDK